MRKGTRLRLVLRDLGAGFAFASMAVSGQLPAWALGLYAVALVLALAGKRPFSNRVKLTAVLLLAVALTLGTNVLAGSLNLVVAACTFAGLISAQRLLSTPDAATDGQVLLSGLLMVAGGAALSGELVYGLFLVVFGVLASISLALGVVESAVPEGEPVPVRSVMGPLAKGVGFAVVGAVAFFIFFPRLNWNMIGPSAAPGLGVATAGFSDTVRLGGAGTIKDNPRIVLRATLSPDPEKEALDAYWVGRTYDVFDGQEWTNARKASRKPEFMTTLRPGQDNLVHQQMELMPAYGARTLVALETPSRLGNAVANTQLGPRRTPIFELGGGEVRFQNPGISYSYEAYSLPTAASGDDLRDLPPEEQDALLSLPEGLDVRVAQTAARVLNGERDPLAAAQKLSAWLQREYSYTLELGGEVPDPVADFLFQRKQGHCEHFATALTLMLRTQGMRARLATGFFGGERVTGGYVVRAGDAHAWTHVLVPGRGFVTVDATPPAHRASQSPRLLEQLINFYEVVESQWRDVVLDYNFRDQLMVARALMSSSRPAPEQAEAPRRGPPPRAWGAAVLAAAAAYAAWRMLAQFLSRERPLEATRFADAVEALLASARVTRAEGETLEDLDARLAREGHPLTPALAPLTRRYLEARFGGRPLQQGEAQQHLSTLRSAVAREAQRLASEGTRPPQARAS
ncbi:transglutaminase TgpA family protein [Myxococcus sp. Y35]|uniref:transglutaminase TgpA family protein n=1 Tax=Pseudomyxococcus flavus TaxID=3115648 RepID=UPI003CEF020C